MSDIPTDYEIMAASPDELDAMVKLLPHIRK